MANKRVKFLYYSLVLFLMLTAVNCNLRKPVAPVWDVQVNFPIVNRPYSIDSLIRKDTSLIRINPTNGLLTYSYSQPAASDSVGDKINMKPSQPPQFKIAAGSIPFRDFSVGVNIPNPGIPSGIIPPGDLPPISIVMPSSDQFDYLEFESGVIRLTVTNSTPITITFDSIRFKDRDDNRFVFDIGSVPPQQSRSAQSILDGKIIRLPLTLDTVRSRTPGSSTPVTIPDPILRIQLDFSNLNINSARAKIPPTDVYRIDSSKFVIDSSPTPTKLRIARFKSGAVDLKLRNDFDVAANVILSLPQLYNRTTQQPFLINRTITRKDSVVIPVNLYIYEFRSAAPTETLTYTASIRQLGSEGDTTQFRIFSRTDELVASLQIHPPPHDVFTLSYVEGILKPTLISFDTLLNIKLGDIPTIFSIDSLRLPDATFVLNLSTPNIPIQIGGNLKLDDSIKYSITIPQTNLAASSTTPVIISGGNLISTLSHYVSVNKTLPNSFKISTSATINPFYAVGSISSSDKIGGNISFDIASNIGIKGGVFRDTLRLGDEKNDNGDKVELDSLLINRLQSGFINFTLSNGIALGTRISIKLLDANRLFIQNLPSTGPIQVMPALVGVDEFASQAVQSKFSIPLNKTELDNLNRAEFAVVEIIFNTPELIPSVKFRNSDKINVRIFCTFNYRLED